MGLGNQSSNNVIIRQTKVIEELLAEQRRANELQERTNQLLEQIATAAH